MRKELGILTLLAVLCILVAALNPQFLSSANIQNTSRLIGTYGIFSIGVGIVIITGASIFPLDRCSHCWEFFFPGC
jgi:ribose transport system permease protein